MTENQLFSMSTELFDTSSNSSNPLKYDLYSLGLTTSVGSTTATALFATFSNTSSGGGISTNSLFNTNSSGGGSGGGQQSSGSSSGSSSTTSGSNVMLTNAITIPRSNNPNQSHNPYQDEASHHPTSSPFFSHMLHQQLQQQQQNLQQQQQQINTMMSSSSTNMQQQQQQQQQNQQQQQHQSSLLTVDYSDYALDALDASSLSPSLLQDVSLSAAATQSLTPGHNSITSVTSPYYTQDPSSPLSNNNGSVGSNGFEGRGGDNNITNISSSSNTDITGVVTFLNSTATADDVASSLLYDSNIAPNSMWSDIGSAIVSTKNEPFSIEDDYIFQLDKSDVHSTGFGDLEGDHFLEDIANLEEFLPGSSGSHDGTNTFHLLSPSMHTTSAQASTPSPGMGPPMELLQQQQQHLQQFTQLQSMQTSTSSISGGGGGGDNSNNNSNAIQIQQQQQQNHQSSSSPYEIYHSTPNKHQLQQQQQQQHTTFSPGSQPSHSPLQMNSITPPPHANRSQYQQSQVKSRNMQELLKKGFSISPDRNNSSSLLGHSVPVTHGLLMSTNALSPGSSGYGSTNGNSSGSSNANGGGGGGGAVISINSARKQFYQSMASNEGNTISRLSSSAPTHLGLEHIWMRREPRQHLLSTGSLAEAESFSSLSTASVLSPDGHDYSQDDDDDNSTDFNSDHYDDLSSDNGSDNEDDKSTIRGRSNSISSTQLSSSKGKERFFWQYNVQAKGPKGKRLVFQSKLEDPHVLNEVTDPVFSPNCSVRGIKVYKHSGKARKGDGNDLTPNPRKLHVIGKELDRLSRTINDMTPVSELPFTVRPKSRKEKNKLASRACRLKKKAQHEANKIKLYGLEIEHKRLINAISDIKQNLALKYRKQNVGENSEDVDQQIERIYKHAIGGLAIAGGSTDFVNKVLDKVKSGQPSGGLEELRNT